MARSTLHRYFPDRAALVQGLAEDFAEVTQRAMAEAALDQGPLADAFRRLVRTAFDLGPRMNFLFTEPALAADFWEGPEWAAANLQTAALFERGRRAGFFTAELDVDWFFRTLYYLVAAGWEAVGEGALARHEALAHVTRTLEGGLLAHGG